MLRSLSKPPPSSHGLSAFRTYTPPPPPPALASFKLAVRASELQVGSEGVHGAWCVRPALSTYMVGTQQLCAGVVRLEGGLCCRLSGGKVREADKQPVCGHTHHGADRKPVFFFGGGWAGSGHGELAKPAHWKAPEKSLGIKGQSCPMLRLSHRSAGIELAPRLLDQAQARASYTPPFGGCLRSLPQVVVSDVQPLVKSFFLDRYDPRMSFSNLTPHPPCTWVLHLGGGGGLTAYTSPYRGAGGIQQSTDPIPPSLSGRSVVGWADCGATGPVNETRSPGPFSATHAPPCPLFETLSAGRR